MIPESEKSFPKIGEQLNIDFDSIEKEESNFKNRKRLIFLLEDFFKGKPKPSGFNIQEIIGNYAKARTEYFKEKEIREKNPNYHVIGWEKIMINHKPSAFISAEDWLRFVSANRGDLTDIVEGHQ